MNFPPILFYDQRFANISTNNYPNQFSSSIISYQNIYKKLLKFENKDKNLQQSVITWLKSLSKIQLIKYFSIGNQWLVDILHEMILISVFKPSTKYIFNPSIKNKEPILSFYNLLEQEKLYLYNPSFSDYFTMCDSGFINLGKISEQEKIQKRFIDYIRYLTIPTNSQVNNNYYFHNNINSNHNNDKENNNKKYFFEFNNVVTLSLEYITNLDNLIDIMQNISNNQLFKNPIELNTEYCENGRKYYYNARLPRWLNSEFSLAELLCGYFELSILINYQYYILYKQEISMSYYDKLEDLMDTFYKLLEFIGNQTDEKRIAVIQCIEKEEIKIILKENYNLRSIMTDKQGKDKRIIIYYTENNYKEHKKPPMKEIVETTMIKYENMFIKGDFYFLLNITFIKNNILFTEEDFITKIVFEKINSYCKNKVAEDLLLELTTNCDNKSHKKRKKKKKRKNRNEENKEDKEKDEKKDDNNKDNEEINNQNDDIKEKIKDTIEIKKIIENEKIGNDNDSIINNINIICELKNNNIKENNLNENFEENSKRQIVVKNNGNEIINNNIIINTEEDNNNDIKEEEQNGNSEENSNNKKIKEKNFFLYPVVKNKNKKNKNKKNKKPKNNINSNSNGISLMKKNSEENHKIKIAEKDNNLLIDNKNDSKNQNIIINNKLEDQNQTPKNDLDHTAKNKNKFNMNMKYKNNNKDKINNFIQNESKTYFNQKYNNQYSFKRKEISNESDGNGNENGNNGHYNQNKNESKISRSKEDNKYFLAGSNLPSFTSFFFKSNKNRNYRSKHNKEKTSFSFISNNISELSKEISENSRKVNKNKEIIQKIRDKYIKKIFEKINIILMEEKVDFLCSFYGSSISGLSIENSDIDIMVKLRQNKNEINYLCRTMENMVSCLNKNNIKYITKIIPIYTASVPVIKIECDLSNDEYFSGEIKTIMKKYDLTYNDITKLYFDITFFEVENEKEKIPSELMIDYIKESISLYPQIIDIIYIMKRFLLNRKLNKSYQGGISSYSLFLLTLAFIKNLKNIYDMPIGSLLIEYLCYYSNFNFYSYVIQPNKDNEKEIFLKNESEMIYKNNLKIIDPITGINVAKSTFKIEEIQKAFKEGFDIITSNLYKINRNTESNNNINNKKMLDNFFNK